MAIRKFNPTSPARRFMTVSTFEEITTNVPEKSLLEPIKKNAGRNSYGRITVRHRGGGERRNTESSISREIKTVSPQQYLQSSTIRTEQQTLLSFSMKTAKRDIFSLRSVSKWVQKLNQAKMLTLKLVTL